MSPLTLLELISFLFLQNHIKWVLILNCWDVQTQLKLTELLMSKNLYVEMKNLKILELKEDFEEKYFLSKQQQVGIFFDLNCKKSDEVLKKCNEKKLFKNNFHWILYDELADFSKFKNTFENFHLAVDADVTYVMPDLNILNTPNNSSFLTFDVYNNGRNLGGKLNITGDQELQCTHMACKVKGYLSSLQENSRYENRWSLRDITMRVTTVITHLPLTEPREKLLAHLQSEGNLRIDGVARYGFANLVILADTLECGIFYNFTDAWSRTELAGGCVGALIVDHSADLTSTPLIPTIKRLPYLTPIMPLGIFRQVCVFRTPRNAGIRGTVYLDPFSSQSWLLFGCLLLFIGLLLWIIFVLEHHQLRVFFNCIPSILATCLISFGSACNQGSYIVPHSLGGRTIFFTLSLLTFIIYNYYTSIVVAILLGTPIKSNIKTLGQLAESNLDVGLEPLNYTKAYLNFSTFPGVRSFVRNKINARRNPDSVWMPIEEGLHKVRDDPGFAYGTDAFSGYYLIEKSYTPQEICDLNEVLLRPLQILHTLLPKNSSYKDIVRYKQIRILESGVFRRLQNIWLRGRLRCDMTSSYVVQVGLEYTAPLFIMLVGTFVLVVMILILEILWHRFMAEFYI